MQSIRVNLKYQYMYLIVNLKSVITLKSQSAGWFFSRPAGFFQSAGRLVFQSAGRLVFQSAGRLVFSVGRPAGFFSRPAGFFSRPAGFSVGRLVF